MALLQRDRSRQTEEEKPLLVEESDSMFDGLSFPDVPTAPPVMAQGKTVPYNGSAISSYDAAVMSKPPKSVVLSDDIEPRNVMRKAPIALPVVALAPTVHADFKSLYTVEKPSSQDAYPVLADEKPSAPMDARQMRATAPLPAVKLSTPGDVEMQPWGKHAGVNNGTPSALRLGVFDASAPTVSTTPTSASHDLVNDLLNENARLKRQLEEMSHGGVAPAQPRIANGPVLTGLSSTDRAANVSTASSTAAGAQSAVGTNPQTQKYVCCGSCKQWLAAPKDANLVHCPGCDSVNDCSLAEARLNRTNARRLETQTWYTQCFQRFLG